MGVEGRRAGLESWGRHPQPPPPLFPNAGGQDSLGLCHRQEAHREHQVSRHRCHSHSAGRPRTAPRAVRRTATLYACVLYLATVAKAYSAMQWTHTPMPPQAERAVTEEAAAEKAAALGLLQPLAELSLDAEELHRATAVAVTYCSAQGASSVADLLERASKLTAYDTQSASSKPGSMALSCDNPGLLNWHQPLCVVGVRPRRRDYGYGNPHKHACRHDLLNGLMTSLALKPVPAKKLSDSFKAHASALCQLSSL